MDANSYIYEDTNYAMQFNTLLMLDSQFKGFDNKTPEFHILGGTALVFHKVAYDATIDIDTANSLNQDVLNIVTPFISDNASEVATLPSGYKKRLVPFGTDVYKNIKVYILSLEDLAVTKLGAWRVKDRDDLMHSDLLTSLNMDLLYSILNNELTENIGRLCRDRLASLVR